jgi:hypothetical protein
LSNESIETLEALIDPKTREVKHLAYQVEGVGDFRREGGKWVPDLEEFSGQFDDLNIIDLDISKAMPLIEQWDTGEAMSEEDVKEYALPEEEE